jgi:nicotinamidase-related amidase
METPPRNETLIVIDVQKGFDDPFWGGRNNPDAEGNIRRILEAWRRTGKPVIHVRHDSRNPASPLRPGHPGNDLKEGVKPLPGEPVVSKGVNSAFIGTDLEERLRRSGSAAVVLVGLTTNHCVSTTARMAANLGFAVRVVSDATATFDMRSPFGRLVPAEEMHEVGLAELDGEFATVVDTAAAIAASDAAAISAPDPAAIAASGPAAIAASEPAAIAADSARPLRFQETPRRQS